MLTMDVKLATLADFASVTKEGKLNILGIFDQVNPPSLPYVHPNMYLVIIYNASPAESGVTKDVNVVMMDADGNQMISLQQQVTVPPPSHPGSRVQINQLMALAGVKFNTSGDYQFSVLIDNDEKGSVSLRVNEPARSSSEVSDA